MAYRDAKPHLKEYNRKWMRVYRARQREQHIIKKGHCPICKILLKPEFEGFHHGCSYYQKIHPEVLIIHKEIEEWREDFVI